MDIERNEGIGGMTATEPRLWLNRIARELERVSHEIDALSETLCEDDALLANSLVALQAIDAIRQQQYYMAQILRADDLAAAAHSCPMTALTTRLVAEE